LGRFFLEPHRHQLRLAARLDLHLRQELPLRLLGGEARDRLELAPLLVERVGESALLVGDGLLTAGEFAVLRARLAEPALELIELARELFVLREHALLDLLDLALALAGLRLRPRARLPRRFPHPQGGALAALVPGA